MAAPRDLIDVYLDAMKESENDTSTTFSGNALHFLVKFITRVTVTGM